MNLINHFIANHIAVIDLIVEAVEAGVIDSTVHHQTDHKIVICLEGLDDVAIVHASILQQQKPQWCGLSVTMCKSYDFFGIRENTTCLVIFSS